MKSRKFLPNIPTETSGPIAKGFLLARSPQGDVAAGAAVRRYELQHNQSPRFARRRQERRKGQALLLAVLIMLLAALLSAGFLAVVSGNLNQSARIADKTRAIEASRAGIAYANAQLSGSSQGDLWRPIDVSPAPDPSNTSSGYDFYYSQLDKVQGWAAKVPPKTTDTFPNATYNVNNYDEAVAVYRGITYGKFPDPNQPIGDAPKFLVKVREVPANPVDPEYEADHVGEIKIISIGLSDDDPNVFHRAVAYKNGRRKSPWAQAFRSVSNWDFKNKTVPQATLSDPSTSAGTRNLQVTVDAQTQQGDFPEAPFNVLVVHKDAATPTNSRTTVGVVTSVDKTVPAKPVYTISGTIPFNSTPGLFVAGDTMQIAASLGTANYVDLLNTGATPPPGFGIAPPAGISTFPVQDQPNGLLINGSSWLQGQIKTINLQQLGTKIQSSGAIFPTNPISVPATGDVATAGILAPSSDVGFPGSFATTSGVDKTELVKDNWDKLDSPKPLGLDYSGDTKRIVKPFVPVDISSPTNLARYRALTRSSLTDSNGYQAGVYIDNRDDVENIYDMATMKYKPMTQKQLVNMLVSPATATAPADYARNGTAATAATNVSLEQRHLRGWVGPDEFLPRGALVEITTDSYPALGISSPSLRVTLDSRSDINPAGPDPNKTWRKTDGTQDFGVYTKVMPWPANGTIFSEGNLRIRGEIPTATLTPRSLTIVSQGNIYIEGSLSANNSKLLLLAKKNVIVNPTRAVVARADVTTRAKNVNPITVAPATPFSLQVASGYAFNVGDYVTVEGQESANDATAKTIRGLVTANFNNQLTIKSPDTGFIKAIDPPTILVGGIVRAPLEKRQEAAATPNSATYSVVDTENSINRRIMVPTIANEMLFDHVGDLKKIGTAATDPTSGLKIKAVNQSAAFPLPATGFTAELTNKQQLVLMTENRLPGAKNIVTSDKMVRIYNNFTTGSKDVFTTPPATKTINQFAAEIAAFAGRNNAPMPADEGYKYAATVEETAPVGLQPSIGGLPYNALAGVGLTYNVEATPFVTTDNGRQPFTTQAGGSSPDTAPEVSYTIPLATSVEFDLNSTIKNLSGAVGISSTYFGFSPDLTLTDDALTVDRYFYQLKTDARKSTLDQRDIVLPSAATKINSLVFRRSDALATPLTSALYPDYRVRGLKLENINGSTRRIQPVATAMRINAFVYAQEGSWFVIPGDYFRTDPAVRGTLDASGNLDGSYIDYNNNKKPDAGEYITDTNGRKVADLNRNGVNDFFAGEREAALRFVRQNQCPIQFTGAILENQTAIVNDVLDVAGTATLETGAVAQWMDKWATYNDSNGSLAQGNIDNFKFLTYTYDPALRLGTDPFLRVPVTDDLLYQQ